MLAFGLRAGAPASPLARERDVRGPVSLTVRRSGWGGPAGEESAILPTITGASCGSAAGSEGGAAATGGGVGAAGGDAAGGAVVAGAASSGAASRRGSAGKVTVNACPAPSVLTTSTEPVVHVDDRADDREAESAAAASRLVEHASPGRSDRRSAAARPARSRRRYRRPRSCAPSPARRDGDRHRRRLAR